MIISYSQDPTSGGGYVDMQFNDQSKQTQLDDTGSWGVYKEVSLGTFDLKKGGNNLKIMGYSDAKYVININDVKIVKR